eukprot:1156584-Pelagomonas_calceolata.AAC.2
MICMCMQYAERNVRFGVREHAMGAIANGIAHHNSGMIPYTATFFIFSDYMRGAMRMSALSEAGIIYGESKCTCVPSVLWMSPLALMTHDSIGLGEDGPTHQPIEQLGNFRAMPNMLMIRPAGGNETAGAYKVGIENRKRPTTIALSRQNMPNLPGTSREGVEKGAYIIKDCQGTPDVIIMGTGSELELAYGAAEEANTSSWLRKPAFSRMCQGPQWFEYPHSLPHAIANVVSHQAHSTGLTVISICKAISKNRCCAVASPQEIEPTTFFSVLFIALPKLMVTQLHIGTKSSQVKCLASYRQVSLRRTRQPPPLLVATAQNIRSYNTHTHRSWRRRARRPVLCPCPAGSCTRSSPSPTRTVCCPLASPSVWLWRLAPHSAGRGEDGAVESRRFKVAVRREQSHVKNAVECRMALVTPGSDSILRAGLPSHEVHSPLTSE